MILNAYEDSKEKVLNLYGLFDETCKGWGKEVAEGIQKQANSIRNENFNLMVLGEAKSGKSTFINAFIQEKIMPMDVRQCTSSIVKLHKGDECKLEAKTADGGQSSYSGVDEVRMFLKEHAAISDKYRSIPITTINNELLIKTKGNPREYQIRELLEHVKKDNIYSLNEEEYNNAIKEYISQEKNNWKQIVTEINITYPLPESMKGITLIDSPGVSAGGNVGIIAENYIKNADAIIFVKSLNGQALESSTFMNFLDANCTNKKKELLFLVLTGTSNLSTKEYNSLKEQALDMYSKKISAEKIICVDSKVELVLNECLKMNTAEEIDSYFDALEENGEEFEPATLAWLKSKDDINKFKRKMKEKSNFDEINRVLNKFARQAGYLLLLQFIDNLKNEYERYQAMFKSQVKLLEDSLGDPEILKKNIDEKKLEMDDTFIKINEGVENIKNKYLDSLNDQGIAIKECDKRSEDYKLKLKKFKDLPEYQITDKTFNELEIMTMNAIEETQSFRQDIAKVFLKECNETLIKYTEDVGTIPASTFKPNFTQEEIDELIKKSKEKSYVIETYEEGMTFKTTKERSIYSPSKHIKSVTDSIANRIDTIINDLKDSVIDFVNQCCAAYKEQLRKHMDELRSEYNKLQDDMKRYNNSKEQLERLKKDIKTIEGNILKLESVRGGIKEYVEE